jgi:4-amino-4-deoxy-L-arabinose transferase-like glycosyltransferase
MDYDDSPVQERLYSNLVKIAFIGSLLVYFWGIWAVPTLSFNEARRMIVVREMLLSGNWLVPTLNGEIYVTKPPLFYWLALPFSLLFHSTAEWVIRLPAALSGFGITWFVFARVKKYIGRWHALFTALTLITCWFFIRFARRAEIEMVLTACCASALLFYFDYAKRGLKRYLYASYLFLGLGFLTKGPVALVFFLPPLLVFGISRRDPDVLKGLLSGSGWLLFGLVALPWYLFISFQLDSGSFDPVIRKDIFHKIFRPSQADPLYNYPVLLVSSFLPWLFVLAYKTKTAASSYLRAIFFSIRS